MAKYAVKYNDVMRSRLIELAGEGYHDKDIAKIVNVTCATIVKWKHNDPSLREAMSKAAHDSFASAIYRGLRILAQGFEIKEEIREEIIEDENGKPIKLKTRITRQAPDIKALKLIAKKFAPELDLDNETNTTNIINIDNMSYKELLDYRSKNNPLDRLENKKSTDIVLIEGKEN